MCCSASYQTEHKSVCSVCAGDHPHVLHRIRCTSETCMKCSPGQKCPVRWKAIQCTARDEWLIEVNDRPHARASQNCDAKHEGKVTKEIKKFVAEQAKGRVTPLFLAARLAKTPTILIPVHGAPGPDKLGNALKRHRNDHSMRNTIEAIAAFVAPRVYTSASENDPERAIVFGTKYDRNGMPKIGEGTDNDPFHLGVTSLKLIDDSLRFVTAGSFSILHADVTFKLSDYAYPVITCGFTDSARSYQLTALFVVSQRTRRDFQMCFVALSDLIRRVRGQPLCQSTLMGDADPAQLRGMLEGPDLARSTPVMCYFHDLYNENVSSNCLPSSGLSLW